MEIFSLLISTAQAQTNTFSYNSAIFGNLSCPSGPSFLPCYFNTLFTFMVQFAIAFAIVMIMVGGFRWLMALGNQSKVGEAKQIIIGAITGLVLALTSYVLLAQINTNLISLEIDFTRPVQVEKLPETYGGEGVDQCQGRDPASCAQFGPNLCIYTPDEGCQPYYWFDYEALYYATAEHRLGCCIQINSSNKVVSSKLISVPEGFGSGAAFCQNYIQPLDTFKLEGKATGFYKKPSEFLLTATTALQSSCWETIRKYVCDNPEVYAAPGFFTGKYCS